jgi:hypothetical protein
VIDSTAYGIASHPLSVKRLQHIGHYSDIMHPWIEPQIVTVWIENNWHAVVNGWVHQDANGMIRITVENNRSSTPQERAVGTR